jgi:hypothetical protein
MTVYLGLVLAVVRTGVVMLVPDSVGFVRSTSRSVSTRMLTWRRSTWD